MTSVIDYCSCESEYEDHCWKPTVYWNEPCPVCTTKNWLEVKEQLSPNIRPPAALGVGEHVINYTFTYNLSSGSLRESKCSAKIRVYAGMSTPNQPLIFVLDNCIYFKNSLIIHEAIIQS